MVCEFLRTSRATYALAFPNEQMLEVQDGWKNGARGKGGTYSYRQMGLDLLARLSTGETVVVKDTSTDPLTSRQYSDAYGPLEIQAFVAVAIIKGQNLISILSVHAAVPREWTKDEKDLLRDVAHRLWDAIERSRSEAELARLMSRYRALAETAASVVLTASPKGRITEISFLCNVEAFPERASLSTRMLNAIHPFDRPHTLLSWRRSVAENATLQTNFRLLTVSGQYRWHSVRALPLRNMNNAVSEWVGSFVDVHERFIQERTLRLLDDFSSRIRDLCAPEEVVTVAQQLLGELLCASRVAYLECLPECEQWWGVPNYCEGCRDLNGEYPVSGPSSAFVGLLQSGKPLVVDDIEQAEVTQELLQHLRSNEIASIICAPVFRDGRMIATMAVHQKDRRSWTSDEMELVRLFCERVCSESQRTRAQQDLQRSEQELRSLNRELDERVSDRTAELTFANEEMERFTYSVAHDLRAPLRSICATSKILLSECEAMKPHERELLEKQALSANRLGQLMDAILNLSRINRQEPKKVRFDFTALVSEVLSDLQVGLCEVRVGPGLFAVGDPLLVRLVLLNLIDNACKFSPSGGIVEVGQKTENGQEAFFVSDQGIGFDQEYSRMLFEPFHRLVKESEFPGTGIGLANVQRIIMRHGGKAWAESTPGKGSTFYFTLNPGVP